MSERIQKTLLVLGSLCLTFLIVEGLSYLVLRNRVASPVIETPENFEIWHPQDVDRFAKESGRTGDIARLLRLKKYDEKKPSDTFFEEDLLHEPSVYSRSENNHSFLSNQRVTPNLNEKFRLIGSRSGKLKYEAHYTTDNFSRRKAWDRGKRNIVFLGCSFTFGNGVNDEETFPYLVGQKLGVRTYNAGVPGGSPASVLKGIREKTIGGEITDDDTTVIFTIIPEHLVRTIGSVSYFRSSDVTFTTQPYAYLDQEKIIIKNSFSEDPTFGKHLLHFLSQLSSPAAFGLDYPGFSEDHYLLMAKIFREMEIEIRRNYPQVKNFYVSFFPTGNARTDYRKMRDTFIRENINVFDFTILNGPTLLGHSFYLRYDGHPSPLTHELYSDLLMYELSKL